MLGVDLKEQYTFIGKDNTSINFMCRTMIDPATSWIITVELPMVTKLTVLNMDMGTKATCILT
jgi:hypothetical protein